MNKVQKGFLETLAHRNHVKKDVVITGPVGSGKTLLGLEAINIKKSHYKRSIRKYYSPNERQMIRVIIVLGTLLAFFSMLSDDLIFQDKRVVEEVIMAKEAAEA